jgi:processive 1,2-diacylglycerol beta-glucosyltransferase
MFFSGGNLVKTQPKILLVTASFGNGHNQVSHALQHTFKEFGVHSVKIYDLYADAYPYWNEIAKFLYQRSFTIGAPLYKLFFYGTDKMYRTKAAYFYCRLGKKRLETVVEEEKPDIIITTFPVGTVPEWRRKTKQPFQLYTVVTDYCLHRTWIHEEIDRYYVATEEVKQKIIQNGISPRNIYVSGIPIRKAFESGPNARQLQNKYGLHTDRKTLLFMAGAYGVVKNLKTITTNILEQSDVQIIVVCGQNKQLYNQLSKLKLIYTKRLHIFGYVDDVHELYAIADAMITKPGGITLSEATAKQLPTILYRPVPGQEKENSLFFSRLGAAVVVSNKEAIVKEVLHLLNHTSKLDEMSQALARIHQKESAPQIVQDILYSFSNRKTSQQFA